MKLFLSRDRKGRTIVNLNYQSGIETKFKSMSRQIDRIAEVVDFAVKQDEKYIMAIHPMFLNWLEENNHPLLYSKSFEFA